ncbi:MAG: DUF4352 domain-containing protein [Thermomicrobiales bacterium]|nr:DUF4352 domain-containing protein [Thermomicrobiales bacterium]
MLLKRALFAMLLVFGIVAGSFGAATAAGTPAVAPMPLQFQGDDEEEATQEADEDVDADDADTRGAAAGGAVEVVDERGNPILAITIEEMFVPWEDYSEYSTPDRGYYFVAMHVTVENISDSEQEVTDFDFMIRDEFGFLYGTSFASIDEDSPSEEIGEFEGDDIDAGDSITGLIVFSIPNEVELVDLFYAPYGRLITVATFE